MIHVSPPSPPCSLTHSPSRSRALQVVVHAAARSGSVEELSCFLRQGLSVDEQDEAGQSPLHAASHYAQPAAVEFLLAQGAGVNVVDAAGQTPLQRAVFSAAKQSQNVDAVLDLLVASGAVVKVEARAMCECMCVCA